MGFKVFFETLKFINGSLSNKTAQAVYTKLMGKGWFAKLKAKVKGTTKKIGLHIKAGAKKIGAEAKKTGLKIKAGAKKIGLKIKAGAKKVAADAKKTGKSIAAKAKAGAKAKGGLKIGGKAKGGLKIGGKAKGGAKLHIKIGGGAAAKKEEPKPVGTCPMAARFGFKAVAAYNRKDKSVCSSLKQTCCEEASFKEYAQGFKKWLKQTSKTLWTLGKIPTIAGVVMGNLTVSTCGGAAKKDDIKTLDDKIKRIKKIEKLEILKIVN